MKNLEKQMQESYSMLLGGMLLALFQEIEDNVVKQARDRVNEFRHALSDGVSSCDELQYTTLVWENVPSAMKEAWKLFETGDRGQVWKTFIAGFTKPSPCTVKTDPDQSYYDQCVVEGQSQAYNPMMELDSFFEELKSSTREVDATFPQVAAAGTGQAA